jgi:membrane associated rhomboid family serine protease
MIPIRDAIPTRRTPVVNYALIALNILVFVLMWLAGSSAESWVYQFAMIPANARDGVSLGDVADVFTSMFMHAGLAHLAGNMLYLWIFGDNVEDRLGHAKFLVFYLLCGIAATFAQVLVDPTSNIPNLGASGAIAGVLGAYLLMFPRGSVRVLMGRAIIPMPALIVIGFWALLQLVNGFGAIAATEQTMDTGGVAYMAHVGGFVAGLILAPLMGGTRQPRLRAY